MRGWQAAYRGMLPGSFLAGLSEDRREESRRDSLASRPSVHVFVVERDRRVVGFVDCGPTEEDPDLGEVYAIYVEPGRLGTGVGRLLMDRAVEDLRERGFARAVLWVLTANERARRFYRVAGWSDDVIERDVPWGEIVLHEARYSRLLEP